MAEEFLDYLEDIPDAMEKAELLLEEVPCERFAEDFRINFAVVRALEIIGEATKRLPMTLREAYPDLPWRGMAGMPDRIIHACDRVDLHMVWHVVKRDIPVLKPKIVTILNDFNV